MYSFFFFNVTFIGEVDLNESKVSLADIYVNTENKEIPTKLRVTTWEVGFCRNHSYLDYYTHFLFHVMTDE